MKYGFCFLSYNGVQLKNKPTLLKTGFLCRLLCLVGVFGLLSGMVAWATPATSGLTALPPTSQSNLFICANASFLSSLNQIDGDFSTIQSEVLKQNYKKNDVKTTQLSDIGIHNQYLLPLDTSHSVTLNSPTHLSTPLSETQPINSSASTKDPDIDSNPAEMYEYKDGGPAVGSHAYDNATDEYYNDKMREFSNLKEKASLLANLYSARPQKQAQVTQMILTATNFKNKFEDEWFRGDYANALADFEQSKTTLIKALFDQVPNNTIEGRAIWLDRASIVKSGCEKNLRLLIDRIANSGFNIIYFETINAGYPIYPSQILPQNPQTKGWDPLNVAIDEAHKQGIELHAWVWTFAVGNTRHNRILGVPDSFPGPILSRSDMASEALKSKTGRLVLPEQYEYWLSPASLKARAFLISLFSEIVKNYPVDGLQLDYIRYPFQKSRTIMGYEPFAIARFKQETGLTFDETNETTLKVWDAWKAFQVTSFVKELSQTLKGINPNIKISAAVFPLAHHSRMTAIQQDWETWIQNGWIDTLSPMAYSRSPRSLEHLVNYIYSIGNNKALVYPGLSLKKLPPLDLINTLDICQRNGVLGTTLFSVNQLDPSHQHMLEIGSYNHKKTLAPHRHPLEASRQMILETQSLLTAVANSGQPSTGLAMIQPIQTSLRTLSSTLDQLSKQDSPMGAAFLRSNIEDESKTLEDRLEEWTDTTEDPLLHFQADYIKHMVDKVIRLVNYTAFQLANTPPGKKKTPDNLLESSHVP